MGQSTRRGFVKNSVAAAAGMTVIGVLSESAEAEASERRGPVVAYVRDARTGDISVMSGDRTVTVRDRQLAARLARAAR